MLLEDIFRILMQNFVIVLVVLFGLSRLFQRTISSQEDKKTIEPAPLPPVSKPFYHELNEKVESKHEKSVNTQDKQQLAVEKREKIFHVEAAEREKRPAHMVFRERERNFSEKQKHTFRLSNDELKNAIIWSEILGPPRAYKKHTMRH